MIISNDSHNVSLYRLQFLQIYFYTMIMLKLPITATCTYLGSQIKYNLLIFSKFSSFQFSLMLQYPYFFVFYLKLS